MTVPVPDCLCPGRFLRGALPADAANTAHECIVKHLQAVEWVDDSDTAISGQTGATVEYFTGSVRVTLCRATAAMLSRQCRAAATCCYAW